MSKKEIAVLGGGCFWCLEAAFKLLPGVLDVESGYAGGDQEKPSYKEVCLGGTGHAEVVRIEYDPSRITFRDLLKVFFEIHDPTTLNRQGADVGTQYRSIILYTDVEQEREARDYMNLLGRAGVYEDIVTELKPFKDFWPAEEEHQDYYDKHPEKSYCQLVVRPKVEKIEKHLDEGRL